MPGSKLPLRGRTVEDAGPYKKSSNGTLNRKVFLFLGIFMIKLYNSSKM